MKKLAIFVEGQTEQLFVEHLLRVLAKNYNISIEKRRGYGGRDSGRSFITLSSPKEKTPFYILLVDSSNDGRVLTDIRESYKGLCKQGYSKIIGLRDVYPNAYKDFRKLRRMVRQLMPEGKIVPVVCFAVLEVETWFIAEYTHFKRIHPRLTRRFIKKEIGFDPGDPNIEENLSPKLDELELSPAGYLHRIYKLVGRSYSKKKLQVQNIIKAMDFKEVINEVPKRTRALGFFIRNLKEFFDSVSGKSIKLNFLEDLDTNHRKPPLDNSSNNSSK